MKLSFFLLIIAKLSSFIATVVILTFYNDSIINSISYVYINVALISSVVTGLVNQYFSLHLIQKKSMFFILIAFGSLIALSIVFGERILNFSLSEFFFIFLFISGSAGYAFLISNKFESIVKFIISITVPVYFFLAFFILYCELSPLYLYGVVQIVVVGVMVLYNNNIKQEQKTITLNSKDKSRTTKYKVLSPIAYVMLGAPIQLYVVSNISNNETTGISQTALYALGFQVVLLIAAVPTIVNYVSLRYLADELLDKAKLKKLIYGFSFIASLLVVLVYYFLDSHFLIWKEISLDLIIWFSLLAFFYNIYHFKLNFLLGVKSLREFYIMLFTFSISAFMLTEAFKINFYLKTISAENASAILLLSFALAIFAGYLSQLKTTKSSEINE